MSVVGLDSSFDRPTPAQAAAAYAAGVRVWGGYIGTRDGLGLATRWSQADFQVVKDAGMTAIGFCSGWDDPTGIRALGSAWGVLPCVDVETGIRTDGLWLDDWLPAAGGGLYGLASVHYEAGRPIGRGAAFNIVANYLAGGCTGETWPSWLSRPARCGWQCQGDHQEFGFSVDRSWLDDWFAPSPPPPEGSMVIRNSADGAVYVVDASGKRHLGGLENSAWQQVTPQITVDSATVAEIPDVSAPPPIDVNALATAVAAALATHPLTASLSDAERDAIAAHFKTMLAAQLAKP